LKLNYQLLDDFFREKKMSFQCPQCSHLKSPRITSSTELAPDARSDEISLQVLRCKDCDYEGLAVYKESSRGGFDSESVDHYGYHANREIIRSVRALIKSCSAWKDARCICISHQNLNLRDKSGRWLRPGIESGQQTYPILM